MPKKQSKNKGAGAGDGVRVGANTSTAALSRDCPVDRVPFQTGSIKPLAIAINGQQISGLGKVFSTGSLGWYIHGKVSHDIDGQPVELQISCNAVIVGTKPGAAAK